MFEFVKENKKVNIIFDSDTPAGVLHDCLMEAKGYVVERIVQAQKEELEICEKYKKLSEKEEESYHGSGCC
jgi:hypothetical protein